MSSSAQRAVASVGPTGTRSGLRIGLCLSGLSGERRWKTAGATRHRMSRNPLNPQVPRLCLVEYRLAYLLWLRAIEVDAARASAVTNRVSWVIAPAGKPEQPRTAEAVSRPSANLLGPRPTFGINSDCIDF